jgi:hypothetical protein
MVELSRGREGKNRNSESRKQKSQNKLEMRKAESRNSDQDKSRNMKFGKQKFISAFQISTFYFGFQPFPFVRLMMVVKIAINSEDSCSKDWVNFGSIAHSSRSSSSQSWLSSASCKAPPSLETNSSSDRARDASRTCAATDVPERSNCLPRTLTSSRCLGSLTKSRMTPAAKALVRPRNSSLNLPWFISAFQISTFYFGFPLSTFVSGAGDCWRLWPSSFRSPKDHSLKRKPCLSARS